MKQALGTATLRVEPPVDWQIQVRIGRTIHTWGTWGVYAIAALLAATSTVFNPALQAVIPALLP